MKKIFWYVSCLNALNQSLSRHYSHIFNWYQWHLLCRLITLQFFSVIFRTNLFETAWKALPKFPISIKFVGLSTPKMAQQAPKAAQGLVQRFFTNLKSKEFRDYLMRWVSIIRILYKFDPTTFGSNLHFLYKHIFSLNISLLDDLLYLMDI